MSITLIVTKKHGGDSTVPGEAISLDQWLAWIKHDASLRLRTEPFTVTNPKTKQTISISPLAGQTEFRDREEWIPFLGFKNSELVMTFGSRLRDENDCVRQKVAEVAKHLGAVIRHDAGDEILNW